MTGRLSRFQNKQKGLINIASNQPPSPRRQELAALVIRWYPCSTMEYVNMLPEKSFAVSPQIEVSERFALVPVSVIASLTAKVRPSAVIVYVALASFADRSGVCWPSRKTLAAITNLTVDHISHATSELRDAGFLTKEVGNNGLTVYRLTVVPLRKAPDKTRSEAFQTASRPDKHEATPLFERTTPLFMRTDRNKPRNRPKNKRGGGSLHGNNKR